MSLLLLLVVCFTTKKQVFSQNIGIEKLGQPVNTDIYQEISPLLSDDGSTLYFTRTGSPDFEKYLKLDKVNLYKKLPEPQYMDVLSNVYKDLGEKDAKNPHRSAFNQDVWVARSIDGKTFEYVYHPGPPLNNALPNSICSNMPRKNNFVIINQFPKEGGMKKGFSTITRISDSLWTDPLPMYIENYYTKSDIVSFSMSKDGTVAIISLKRDDTKGENDLYIIQHIKDSLWSEPLNLGAINSPYNDITPHLSDDMRTLFFSSNRPGTTGGYDIFMCTKQSSGWNKWSEPKPMIEPINSTKDDLQPHYNSATGYLYFSTRRSGSSDIYRAKIGDPNPLKITILGRAIDSKTLRPVSSSIYIGNGQDDNYKKLIISETGEFTIVAGRDDVLKIYPYRDGYLSQPQIIDLSKVNNYIDATEINFYIDQKAVNGRINLNPIFFLQSKPTILEKSLTELEKLADLLKNNQNMSIRIEGHTDNLGDPNDLQKLSEDRAIAVKEFLIKKGINESRLETKGLGAKQPVNNNNTQEQRELNRRVEFIITKI
jgi:outer membrane protein OmpA-like peptidoglycan-associated protein